MQLFCRIISLGIIFVGITELHGQAQRLNFGLKQPQDSNQYPITHAKFRTSISLEKRSLKVQRIQGNTTEWKLDEDWQLSDLSGLLEDSSNVFSDRPRIPNWISAIVPSTVLTSLVANGIYPDPLVGLNNRLIPDSLCRKDWWYRKCFDFEVDHPDKDYWLNFEGINYRAEVWLNHHYLGRMDGAFCRGKFKMNGILNLHGSNVLLVHILPPSNPGIAHEQSLIAGAGPNGGQLCMDGPTFICSEGWDWIPGIRDRNIGIWQDVWIQETGKCTMEDPQVITILPLPDTTQADIFLSLQVSNRDTILHNLVLNGFLNGQSIDYNLFIEAKCTKKVAIGPKEIPLFHIQNPKLWWPNGYGAPSLNQLNLNLLDKGICLDHKTIWFGIRELSYELTATTLEGQIKRILYRPALNSKADFPFQNRKRKEMGNGVSIPGLLVQPGTSGISVLKDTAMSPYLVIQVNGKRIFCKGGNWGMDDAMKRVSKDKIEPYIRMERDAHFNMIRNWTGESTEEVFFNLCDQYGLLVWNDFWLSTEGYNLEPNDNNLFLKNAKEVILRFRNHPCIAIWCPRNEGYAPDDLDKGLIKLITDLDGSRFYQGNSRYLNLKPSGPWHFFTDPIDYYRNEAQGFLTELGTPSVPDVETMKEMLPEGERWPINDAWAYHDFHSGQKSYCRSIDSLFGPATSLEDFCRKAQFLNLISHKTMFEAWNTRMWNNTSGLLLWMSHPSWPSTIWQVYGSNYSMFGSYFGCQSACEPIHVQWNPLDNTISVVNTSLKSYQGAHLNIKMFRMDGTRLFENRIRMFCHADTLTQATLLSFSASSLSSYHGLVLIRLTLSDSNQNLLSFNEYLIKNNTIDYREINQYIPVKVQVEKIIHNPINGKLTLVLHNIGRVPAINVHIDLFRKDTHLPIRPFGCNRGYFIMLPGERTSLEISTSEDPANIKFRVDGYNVKKE